MGWLKDKIFQKSSGTTSNTIDRFMENWLRHLFAYRLDNDHVLKTKLLAEGVDLEDGTQDPYEMARVAPMHVLKNTVEYHIVYIITHYSRLLAKAGNKYTWKDVLHTIDVDLPKPRGHIPVHMWAPDGLYEYLAYRVSIDFPGELYPFHIMEGTIRELISNSEEALSCKSLGLQRRAKEYGLLGHVNRRQAH